VLDALALNHSSTPPANRRTPLLQTDWSLQQRVEVDAPSNLQLPTGSTVPIDYSGSQPKARVKLQEVFGLADTPLLGGRGVNVPLLLELLSPAGRPLQVCAGALAGAVGQRDSGSRATVCLCMCVLAGSNACPQCVKLRHHLTHRICVLLCPWLTHTHKGDCKPGNVLVGCIQSSQEGDERALPQTPLA
jgi:hypothetical protein